MKECEAVIEREQETEAPKSSNGAEEGSMEVTAGEKVLVDGNFVLERVEKHGNARATAGNAVDLCEENDLEPTNPHEEVGYYELMQSEEVETLMLEDLKDAPLLSMELGDEFRSEKVEALAAGLDMNIGSGLVTLAQFAEIEKECKLDWELDRKIGELIQPYLDMSGMARYVSQQAIRISLMGQMGETRWNTIAMGELTNRNDELCVLMDRRIQRANRDIEAHKAATLEVIKSVERRNILRGDLDNRIEEANKEKRIYLETKEWANQQNRPASKPRAAPVTLSGSKESRGGLMEAAKKLIARCDTPLRSSPKSKGATIWGEGTPLGLVKGATAWGKSSPLGSVKVQRESTSEARDLGGRYSHNSENESVDYEVSSHVQSFHYYDGQHGRRDRDDNRRHDESSRDDTRRHDESRSTRRDESRRRYRSPRRGESYGDERDSPGPRVRDVSYDRRGSSRRVDVYDDMYMRGGRRHQREDYNRGRSQSRYLAKRGELDRLESPSPRVQVGSKKRRRFWSRVSSESPNVGQEMGSPDDGAKDDGRAKEAKKAEGFKEVILVDEGAPEGLAGQENDAVKVLVKASYNVSAGWMIDKAVARHCASKDREVAMVVKIQNDVAKDSKKNLNDEVDDDNELMLEGM
ncbi:hypothetical protein L211DRAFT_851498 [Terfezia boudieri ATCC MYA-4762]|uniref:Uncharacterized protein n=1 Tax=Terfezia boudieri ATCC MYA-4762 TaxID=1051890 RepID=A0A3N4LF79_9PEZI|nr:hypothetical protein L211DRAFT_851498 [Terfezia boudieri ATCC MYA-4762]